MQQARALHRVDGEIRASKVSHEQRVAGQQHPDVRSACQIGHRKHDVLRPMAGRGDRAYTNVADGDLLPGPDAVLGAVAGGYGVVGAGAGDPRQAATADVIGMVVRVEDVRDPQLLRARDL